VRHGWRSSPIARRSSLSAFPALTIAANLLVFAPSSSAHEEVPRGKVAYTTVLNGREVIFVFDPANTSDRRPLVDLGDRDASDPAWSFDGARIAFTAQESPGGPTAIFVADADGTGITQVTYPDTGESDSDASWSPKGDEIVFARTLASGLSRILVVDLGTLALRALDSPSLPTATETDWSPEGSRIAFVAKESVPTRSPIVSRPLSGRPRVPSAEKVTCQVIGPARSRCCPRPVT
jgi:Tol biopolymer transport system component